MRLFSGQKWHFEQQGGTEAARLRAVLREETAVIAAWP
jgi:hypothetical protein